MSNRVSKGSRWGRLFVGLGVIALFYLLLTVGALPAGMAGEVLRNNLDKGIDATPFFYTEAEGIPQMGQELRAALAHQRNVSAERIRGISDKDAKGKKGKGTKMPGNQGGDVSSE